MDNNFQEHVQALLEDDELENEDGAFNSTMDKDNDENADSLAELELPLELRKQKLHNTATAMTTNQTKRLEFLLKQAEVFAHFMRPTYTAALKELNPNSLADAAGTSDSQLKTKRKVVYKKDRRKEDMKMLLAKAKAHHSDDEDDEGDLPLSSSSVFYKSPSFICNGTMRDYQIKGLNWLISLYNNGINGILADEMGLGKTLQTIALLGYLKNHKNVAGPHLIIAPKSTLPNWMNELAKWCPSLKTLCLIGHNPGRREFMKKKFYGPKWDVCVTSYEMVLLEFHALKKVGWVYVVIDEAQRVKNDAARLSSRIRLLKSKNRLMLTGTPLQNNLHELWVLLNYLLPEVFNSAEEFDTWFNTDSCAQDANLVGRLHTLLRPFLLRRIKSDVEKSLPPKREIKIYVSLTPLQRVWYRKILLNEVDILSNLGDIRAVRLHNILMHLRKVCNHPYIFRGAEPGPPFTTDQRIVENSGKMRVLDKLLEKLKAEGSRVLLFSQFTTMLDIIEDYCVWKGYEYLRLDGKVAHEQRQKDIDEFNAPNSTKFIFLLSTRAGGLGINLATADVAVLYDSDWNPQVDLQAQDRCHRIGQTKEVRVFRFVTEQTVEEKIRQIAQKKLWLDHKIIQQGRLVDVGSNRLDKHNLQEIIKYGAEDILQGTLKTFASTDFDIDEILRRSKEKEDHLAEMIARDGGDGDGEPFARNFVMDDDSEFDMHKFEGQDFRQLRKEKKEENKFILGRQSIYEAVEPVNRTDSQLVSGQDSATIQIEPPPLVFDFQFFPHRYYQLVEKELDFFRKSSRLACLVEFSSDELQLNKIRGIERFERERVSCALPLTEKEVEEKAQLEQEGFASWTRKDFETFLRRLGANEANDLNDGNSLNLISQSIPGKSPEEVVAFHQVFSARSHEIYNFEELYSKYGLHKLVSECLVRIENLLDIKINQYKYSRKELKIKYPSTGVGPGSRYTKRNDRDLLATLHEIGPWTKNVFEVMCSQIQASNQFDLSLRARNAKELQSRCCFLLQCIQKEFECSQDTNSQDTDTTSEGTSNLDLTSNLSQSSDTPRRRSKRFLPNVVGEEPEMSKPKRSSRSCSIVLVDISEDP